MTEREMGTTEHTEKNFDPSNYEVVDYFDNRRPQYFGQSIEEWKSQIEYWQQSLKRVYGEDWVHLGFIGVVQGADSMGGVGAVVIDSFCRDVHKARPVDIGVNTVTSRM